MATLKGASGPFVGLDIGGGYIKAVQASLARGRVEVTGVGIMPVPGGLIDNNVVVDPQALGQEIKRFLTKCGISSKKCISSVAGQSSLVVRIIPVPKMTRAELNETMKWEIERHVPFPAAETVWDFQPLTAPEMTPDNENIQVLLAVAQEMLINGHVDTLTAAGLQPVAIDVEPLAASRALLELSGNGTREGVVALVDMGANTSDISIFRDGIISFTRTMPIAGRTFTQAIGEMTGQPMDHAERLKKELAHVPAGLPLAAGEFGDQFGFGDFGEEQTDFGEDVEITAPPGSGLDFGSGLSFDLGASPDDETAGGSRTSFDLGDEDGGGSAFGAAMAAAPAPAPVGTADEEYLRQQITDAITPILGELVTELRRSLDYYRNNSGHAVDRVILCGGTSKLAGLDAFLGEHLGVPVVLGNPMGSVNVAAKVPSNYMADVSPIFSVSLGLAVREMLVAETTGRSKK